jgi:outer membrane protein TolC
MIGAASRYSLAALVSALFLVGASPPADAQQTDFTLEECIEMALNRNAAVVQAKNNYSSAKQNYLEAWGDALPRATTSASYSYRDGVIWVPELGRNVSVPPVKSYSTDVNLSMTLFDGGATWFRIIADSRQKGSAEAGWRSTVQSIVLNVKSAYYWLLSRSMLRRAQADALERSKKQLEVTEARYELGSASLSEKLKQQVNVASDSLALLERQNDIRKAEFALNLLMNRDVTLRVMPVDTLAVVTFARSLDDCIEAALDNNPGLRQSRLDVSAASAQVKAVRGSWLPAVSAGLGWNWSPRQAENWLKYKSEDRGYYFGVTISYSLFDAFKKKTNYSRARLLERNYQVQLQAEQNSVIQEVKGAYLDIEKSRLQYETAQLLERSAQEDLKLQQERYRLGASSILELLDAQASLTQAQYQRINALYELNVAVATMTKAIGEK